MKKLISLVLVALLVLSAAAFAEDISIVVNLKTLSSEY